MNRLLACLVAIEMLGYSSAGLAQPPQAPQDPAAPQAAAAQGDAAQPAAGGQRGGRGQRGQRGRGAGPGGRRGPGRQGGGRQGGDQPASFVVPEGAQAVVLWPNGAPGSEDRKDEPEQIQGETIVNVHNPSIVVFLPPKEIHTGVGLVLAPGGGHTSLWVMHEGFNPAQFLAARGVATFVLKNRLESSGYRAGVEGVADMQRAIKVVRSHAQEWGVDPAKVGAGGFSAGGELAARVADRNDPGDPNATDPVERFSSRPDFQALIYPGRSRQAIQPTPNSPPAFLAAGADDREDISFGLAEAYLRFKEVGVPVELHMYAHTGHGFGLRPERAEESNQEWPTQLISFLRQSNMITTPPAAPAAAPTTAAQ